MNTSRVPAVLLRGNLTNSYIVLPIFIALKLSIDFIIRYVSVNIIGKIITKPNIFTGTRSQDSFWICDLSSYILLADTNITGLDAILLSCTVSELQEPPSPGLELKKLFPSFDLLCSLLVSKNKHAKFDTNRFTPSRAISEHTYKHKQNHNFNFTYLRVLFIVECELL
jgi:hypothetical protein